MNLLLLVLISSTAPCCQSHFIRFPCYTHDSDFMGNVNIDAGDVNSRNQIQINKKANENNKKLMSSKNEIIVTDTHEELEHALRTDEWLVKFHIPLLNRVWSTLSCMLSSSQASKSLHPLNLLPSPPLSLFEKKMSNLVDNDKTFAKVMKIPKNLIYTQVIKFHPNGFVLVVENSSTRKTKIGRWGMNHGNLSWEIPVRIICNHDKQTNSCRDCNRKFLKPIIQLQYNSDIHVNKFGKKPKMFRGVITRDR